MRNIKKKKVMKKKEKTLFEHNDHHDDHHNNVDILQRQKATTNVQRFQKKTSIKNSQKN
jgi:hypothetical protein